MEKIALKVTMFTTKKGKKIPCMMFGNKIVTFDEVIISAITNLSIRDIQCLDSDIILGEF